FPLMVPFALPFFNLWFRCAGGENGLRRGPSLRGKEPQRGALVGKPRRRIPKDYCLFRRTKRKEVLCPLHGVLQAAQQLLQVGAALYKVDFRGIDHEQIGGGVAEEE